MMRTIALIFIVILTGSCRNEKSSEANSPATADRPLNKVSNDTVKNLLRVENPAPGQLIGSPLEITGEARGYWFFEANATVELLDERMNKITETYITAIGEWMTEDWVPFTENITFEKPATKSGFLVLHKANASGLKEHAMSDTIPVRFQR